MLFNKFRKKDSQKIASDAETIKSDVGQITFSVSEKYFNNELLENVEEKNKMPRV